MNNLIHRIPPPTNEPVLDYAPGSPERAALQAELAALRGRTIDVPAFIGGEEVRTGRTTRLAPPHDHAHTLGHVHECGPEETARAIEAALAARSAWADMHYADRAAIFLRAAELAAGPWRATLNAATMLGQSKNAYQAEIDSACELIDFFRFNAHYMEQVYTEQPQSAPGVWNRLQYRPLEGFVFAVTPFNFTAIQANLPTAPAMMGNVVLWKPSTTAAYSAYFVYKLLEAAGLPPGVINLLPATDGAAVGDAAFASPHFAGLHFTGSTSTFKHMWKTIGANIDTYRTYPRIVGETGGKDFILMHPTGDAEAVGTAIVRGGFEYQGQKCSAASRVYLPSSQWEAVRAVVDEQMASLTMGPVEDFTHFVNAVIDRRSFDKIKGYLDAARDAEDVEILHGGTCSDETGYFVEPTILRVQDPRYRTMCEEIFGPVVTVYVYDDADYGEVLELIDDSTPYALTGAVFARDRDAIVRATEALGEAAGNFYINDKPTGAVVGQQPFGGGRASGTNDKAGSYLNLVRWVSPRAIKETFVPARDYRYPFLAPDAPKDTDERVEAGNGHAG